MNITPEELSAIRGGLVAAWLHVDKGDPEARFANEKLNEAIKVVEELEKQLPSRR